MALLNLHGYLHTFTYAWFAGLDLELIMSSYLSESLELEVRMELIAIQ